MATEYATRFKRNDMRMLLYSHGETIIYHPAIGAPRTIQALIERDVSIPGEVEQVAHAIVVRVLDDATKGITSTEINDGGDAVDIRVRLGEARTRRQITRRITSVAGVTRFLVR